MPEQPIQAPQPFVAPGYEEVADALGAQLAEDPGYSAQVAAFVAGQLVVDLWGGPHMRGDSLICVYSVSKGLTGLVLGRLIDQGVLDLDKPVAASWPEFAQAGKQTVSVRQLLSHQAGLPEVDGGLPAQAYHDDSLAAELLARQRPFWQPGSAWGYHALTLGFLANELCRRLTGRTVQQVFEEDIRAPRGLDVYLGLPEELEPRTVQVLLPDPPPSLPGDQLIDLVGRGALGDPGLAGIANSREGHRIGTPAAGGVASARGLAGAYAAALGHDRGLFTEQTFAAMGQIHSSGRDITNGAAGRFGVVFQKPHPGRPFAGYRAIGHDGAAGSLGFADPDGDVAFGFTTNRIAPEGGDRRADALAAIVLRVARARSSATR